MSRSSRLDDTRMTSRTTFWNSRRLSRCARSLAFVGSFVLGSATLIQAQPARGLANQPVDARTRAELETAREAVWRAWFAGDSAALERLIPGALAAGSPLEWEDRAATLEGSRRAGISGRRLVAIRFDSTTIDLRDDVALIRARYAYILETPDGKRTTGSGIAAEIFVREDGHWVNPFWYLK